MYKHERNLGIGTFTETEYGIMWSGGTLAEVESALPCLTQ